MRMGRAVLPESGTNSAIPRKPTVKWEVKENSNLAFQSKSSNTVGSQRKSKEGSHYKNLYPLGQAFVYIHQGHTTFN